jgi:hypothetical protein
MNLTLPCLSCLLAFTICILIFLLIVQHVQCFKCVTMANELYSMMMRRPKTLKNYEINLSNKITKCAREMRNMKGSEFPAAAVALKVCPSLPLRLSPAAPASHPPTANGGKMLLLPLQQSLRPRLHNAPKALSPRE